MISRRALVVGGALASVNIAGTVKNALADGPTPMAPTPMPAPAPVPSPPVLPMGSAISGGSTVGVAGGLAPLTGTTTIVTSGPGVTTVLLPGGVTYSPGALIPGLPSGVFVPGVGGGFLPAGLLPAVPTGGQVIGPWAGIRWNPIPRNEPGAQAWVWNGSGRGNSFVETDLVCDQQTLAQSQAQGQGASLPQLTAVDGGAEFLNAWGISAAPAGLGGSMWVAAGGYVYSWFGDVQASPDPQLTGFQQDVPTRLAVPGAGAAQGGSGNPLDTNTFQGFVTGVATNGSDLNGPAFRVQGQATVNGQTVALDGSARVLVATDTGVISGWTDRSAVDGSVVRGAGSAVPLIDNSQAGHSYFGLAVRPGAWDRLWAADFGTAPQIRGWDAAGNPISPSRNGFVNPFVPRGRALRPGDYVPWNIQVIEAMGESVVAVCYVRSQADPKNPSALLPAAEDARPAAQEGERPDRGRVALFDLNGRLIRRLSDGGRLNAPWGVAVAPSGFGGLGDCLLVGNFGGSGRIAAFSLRTGRFVDYLRYYSGQRVQIDGLWGLAFGNGDALGDADALYFTAGPRGETGGLLGSLRFFAPNQSGAITPQGAPQQASPTAPGPLGAGQPGIGQNGIGQPGIGQNGIGQNGIGQNGIGQNGIGQNGNGPVGAVGQIPNGQLPSGVYAPGGTQAGTGAGGPSLPRGSAVDPGFAPMAGNAAGVNGAVPPQFGAVNPGGPAAPSPGVAPTAQHW